MYDASAKGYETFLTTTENANAKAKTGFNHIYRMAAPLMTMIDKPRVDAQKMI